MISIFSGPTPRGFLTGGKVIFHQMQIGNVERHEAKLFVAVE